MPSRRPFSFAATTGRWQRPGRSAAIWLLPLLLVTGGCAHLDNWFHNGFKVGPNYMRPAAPVAEQWIDSGRFQEFNGRSVIAEGHCVDDAAWWTTFQDPEIDFLVQTAYQQNLPLRVAGLRVLEAEAQRSIAVGNLFPQFQESFGALEHTQISRNNLQTALFPARAFSTWSTGFNASWELDLWGRLRRAIESTDANLDASVEDYDDALVSLIAETAAAYIDIRTFEQRLVYARANVATQEKNLQLAQARFDAGAVEKLDVTQATASLEQTRALIPDLEAGLRISNNVLCILLGIPPRDLVSELGEAPIPSPPPEVVVGIPADLIRRRPDVRRAERQVAAQSALIGVAAADLFPTFTINGSLNWQAQDFGDLFEPASAAGFIAPQFNWNILNYGRIVHNVRVQEARFQQLAVAYQQSVLSANAEAENAIIGFLKAQQSAAALRKTVAATQESVRLADTQYREGLIDFDRVNNLQRQLVTQQDDLARAQAQVALNLIAIYRALGGGWQIRYGMVPGMMVDGHPHELPADGENDPPHELLPPPPPPPTVDA
jgi:NodT family efflux transporter outer membrane factor (OMF) lipoprotein